MIMSLLYVVAPGGRIAEAVGLYKTLSGMSHIVIPVFFGSVGAAFGFMTVFLSNSALLAFGGFLQRRNTGASEVERGETGRPDETSVARER